MRYLRQLSRCTCLILLMAAVGLRTSATTGAILAGPVVDQQFSAATKSFGGEMRLLPFTSSEESKGLSAYPLAYVDPGSGQFILQMLVAACVGALFYVKRVRVFLRKLVDKWFKKR
jgi:hypothetical protein